MAWLQRVVSARGKAVLVEATSLLGTLVTILLGVVLGVSPGTNGTGGTVGVESEPVEAPVVEVAPEPEVQEAPCVSVLVVEPVEPWEFTPDPAQVEVVTGSIGQAGEVQAYDVTPAVSGVYSFEMGEMHVDFSPNIALYDHLGTCMRDTDWGASNGSNIVARLEAGKTYRFEVQQYEGTGSYQLTMGMQRETLDLTQVDVLHDQIGFTGQELNYTFTPAETGRYRFEFSEMMVDFSPNITITDRLGASVRDTDWGLSNGGGVTVSLVGGDTYTLTIAWYEGFGTFDMHIGKQAPVSDITDFDAVCDQITFMEQVNVYAVEVDEPGTFALTLLNMHEGVEVNIKVINRLGEVVGETSYGRGNGEGLEVDMVPGETFTIEVTWYEGTGYYELWLEQIAWG